MVKKDKTWDDLVKYCKDQELTPDETLAIIEQSTTLNPTNKRTQWKMYRLTMFLWARYDEHIAGYLGKKAETIKRLIKTEKYRKMYMAFNSGPINPEKEFKNLQYLVNDPRQAPVLKSKYFYFEYTKKPIPQELIDKLK